MVWLLTTTFELHQGFAFLLFAIVCFKVLLQLRIPKHVFGFILIP